MYKYPQKVIGYIASSFTPTKNDYLSVSARKFYSASAYQKILLTPRMRRSIRLMLDHWPCIDL